MTREQLLLISLAEECSEVAQRASKALRFGMNEVEPEQLLTNKQRLIAEFNDLVAVMEMLQIQPTSRVHLKARKKAKVEKFMEYSRKLGILTDKP